MDKSHNTHKEFAQQTCAEHTRKLLGGKSGMMFYDVTSFALRHGDTLSKVGLSKDGMTAEPQYPVCLCQKEAVLFYTLRSTVADTRVSP